MRVRGRPREAWGAHAHLDTPMKNDITSATISTRDMTLAGQALVFAAGLVNLDKDGRASVSIPLAAEATNAPHDLFKVTDPKEAAAVARFLKTSIERMSANGVERYDAGPLVCVACADLAGASVVAPDNVTVRFNAHGYAEMGENTALAMRSVLGGNFSIVGGVDPDDEDAPEPDPVVDTGGLPASIEPEVVTTEAPAGVPAQIEPEPAKSSNRTASAAA